jgi:hypothetical protein
MRHFLVKLALWAVPLVVVFATTMAYFAPRMQDEGYYGKLSAPRCPSLILGSSRAHQGLIPQVFSASALSFDRPIENFAFNADDSPYGAPYLRAIQQKLAESSTQGLFILDVNFMNLSDDSKDVDGFIEKMHFFTLRPNYEYLLRFYTAPYYTVIVRALRQGQARLHPDGWMEVDGTADKQLVESLLESYREQLSIVKLSPQRMAYLEQIILFLRAHGRVVLVRMPAGSRRRAMEDVQAPGLSSLLQSVARRTHCSYFDFWDASPEYRTRDESHLTKESAEQFSRALLAKIQSDPATP